MLVSAGQTLPRLQAQSSLATGEEEKECPSASATVVHRHESLDVILPSPISSFLRGCLRNKTAAHRGIASVRVWRAYVRRGYSPYVALRSRVAWLRCGSEAEESSLVRLERVLHCERNRIPSPPEEYARASPLLMESIDFNAMSRRCHRRYVGFFDLS